jgi:F-type H+-transporting ATPase subunit delta
VKDTSVAARYARALFIVTEKRGETARALGDLKSMLEVLKPGTRVANFLATPQVRLADKREVLRAGFRGKALPIVAVFVDLLLRKRRLEEFPEIVTEFEALVERAQGIRRVQVTSATALTATELERLERSLERYTQAKLKITTTVDPDLLGGALVRIGDRVADRSARTLLQAIARQLHEVSV